MSIQQEFIEIIVNNENSYIAQRLAEALKKEYGVFRIHKYPKEKPMKEGFYIVRTFNDEIGQLYFSLKSNKFSFSDERVTEWFEFDDMFISKHCLDE